MKQDSEGRRPRYRPMRRMAALGVAAVVAAMSSATLTGRAIAARPASGTSSSGIISVSHANPLPGARVIIEPGVLEDGECLMRGHLEGEGGNPGAIVQRIIEADLTTCQITLERVEIDLEDLHNYDPSTPAGMFASSTAAEGVANDTGPLFYGAVNHYVGSIKLNWEDPPDIDVTTTKSTVKWRQRQGESCLSGADFEAHWGWYSPTGWRRDTASWQHDFDCGYASMNTYGTYHNPEFCPTGTTYTDHYNTFFSGRPNGAWRAEWGADKSGGCTNLLDREHIIVHP